MEDLFSSANSDEFGLPLVGAGAPLAARMRPRSLDEMLGQNHLLATGSPLRRLLEPAAPNQPVSVASVILWGPPGTGKTTLAYLIARLSGRRFAEISAVSSGVKEVRAVIDEARRTLTRGVQTVLFVDEVHRFSKSQQDVLLPAVENQWVTLVAATTENPSFSVNPPLLSRSLLLVLQPLSDADIEAALQRALADERGLDGKFTAPSETLGQIIRLAGGDARKSLTLLEATAGVAENERRGELLPADVGAAAAAALTTWDEDQHYDVASAFIKSMRGSDPDATVHYLARMIEGGEDPRFIARRIMIAAAEEVGLADTSVLRTAVAAAEAVAMVGMPEARIILAEAALAVATAPKSNASYLAIDQALADLRAGKSGAVPMHLRDAHYAGAGRLGHGEGYRYAHDQPNAIASQQYLPDELEGTEYYRPNQRGDEILIGKRLAKIREILRMR